VGLSVVIVDDSEEFLASARALLELQGMNVVGVAATPAEGLERVRQLRPDVVLIDLNLGPVSGLELASQLSADGAVSPALVVVSTIGREDLAALLDDSPVHGFLTKTDLSATAVASIVAGTGLVG
jgi:DNA-binding NarL/FixJ family response regulator